jgi:hypothetical protein
MKLQHQKDLAIAIAAILAIAVILSVMYCYSYCTISRLIGKPQLSCATVLEEVVFNYFYSKLRTAKFLFLGLLCGILRREKDPKFCQEI